MVKAIREAGPNRFLECTAWVFSLAALVVAIGVQFKSSLSFDELVSQGSLQASVSQLPSLRFLRLQIQIAEQRESYEQRVFAMDSPLVALAYVNRWVTEETIPEQQPGMVQEVCNVLRDRDLPERYRAFCLSKLNESSDRELMMLSNELAERWKAEKESPGQALSGRRRNSDDKEQP